MRHEELIGKCADLLNERKAIAHLRDAWPLDDDQRADVIRWLEAHTKAAAEIERLDDWLVETQMNAHQWMVAHDKLAAGKPYEFPKPADLPSHLAQLVRLLKEARWYVKDGLVDEIDAALAKLEPTPRNYLAEDCDELDRRAERGAS